MILPWQESSGPLSCHELRYDESHSIEEYLRLREHSYDIDNGVPMSSGSGISTMVTNLNANERPDP
ncbi:MAG: hypothetical protein NPIRA02_35510 [Nitrospirales bacterium]|nr:MAG: hypothetical protein NPIRA02_35510 [Nitrospirales bacterium]